MNDFKQPHRTPFFLVILGLLLATAIGIELSLYLGVVIFSMAPQESLPLIVLLVGVIGTMSFFELRKMRKAAPFVSWREVGVFDRFCFIAGVLFFTAVALALFVVNYRLILANF